jgi:Carboxypeptidase regulatory-like domain
MFPAPMMHTRYGSGKIATQITAVLSLFVVSTMAVWAVVGGALSGAVTVPDGAAVAGARVVAVSAAQGLQTKTNTDAKGAYRFPALAVGQYDLKVEAPGYKPSLRRVVIHVDDKARLDIVLEPESNK